MELFKYALNQARETVIAHGALMRQRHGGGERTGQQKRRRQVLCEDTVEMNSLASSHIRKCDGATELVQLPDETVQILDETVSLCTCERCVTCEDAGRTLPLT